MPSPPTIHDQEEGTWGGGGSQKQTSSPQIIEANGEHMACLVTRPRTTWQGDLLNYN